MKKFLISLIVFALFFTMPGMSITSNALAYQEVYPVAGSIFDDVSERAWYHPYVTFVLNKGIMSGIGNNLFAPDKTITRAEFATIIYRFSGSPDITFSSKFSDVPNDQYYSKSVTWASQPEVGIIHGYGNGTFRPSNRITREEMAAMLYRYAIYCGFISLTPEDSEPVIPPEPSVPSLPDAPEDSEVNEVSENPAENTNTVTDSDNVLSSFRDASNINAYALDAFIWSVNNTILVGDNNGYLDPKGNASRAASAAVLQRMYVRYMYGRFPNIDLSASTDPVTAAVINENKGTFSITVTNPNAALSIASIQAVVYSRPNKSDKHIYTLTKQEDGSYQVTGDTSYHNYSTGTFTVESAVLLTNGVRITTSSTTINLKNVWNLILANPWNSIPPGYTVELASIGAGHSVDKRIVKDLNNMFAAMRSAGLSPAVCSSYRTQQKQETLFENKLHSYLSQGFNYDEAYAAASKWVAIPGTSEHQLGLAVDIVDNSYWILDSSQEKTKVQQWLMKNSYKYGFILRYPSNKSDITGIGYEPWHYRYVGKTAAKEIYEKNICLEEYLKTL